MIYPSIDALLQKLNQNIYLLILLLKGAKEMDETNYFQMKENEYKSSKILVEL